MCFVRPFSELLCLLQEIADWTDSSTMWLLYQENTSWKLSPVTISKQAILYFQMSNKFDKVLNSFLFQDFVNLSQQTHSQFWLFLTVLMMKEFKVWNYSLTNTSIYCAAMTVDYTALFVFIPKHSNNFHLLRPISTSLNPKKHETTFNRKFNLHFKLNYDHRSLQCMTKEMAVVTVSFKKS